VCPSSSFSNSLCKYVYYCLSRSSLCRFNTFIDISITSQIKLGDDYQNKVLGKGVIFVLTMKGEKKDIHDVYYVPSLRHNLMSVGQMNKNGYRVIF